MNRRPIFNLLKQTLRSSSTSSGLRGQQQPTKVMTSLHHYPKIDAMSLVAQDLEALWPNIHKELEDELKCDIELGNMAK